MAEPSNPTILVDVHEGRSGIAGHLEELGARVEIRALPAGDYVVGEDTVGSIEQVIVAREEELLRVPGVGPERARALLETLRRRHARPHQ